MHYASSTNPGLIKYDNSTLVFNGSNQLEINLLNSNTWSAAQTFSTTIVGTTSGNTTYTASNHGVVISGSSNAMTVIAPDASTTKVLTSGGLSADPSWQVIPTTVDTVGTFDSQTASANGSVISGATSSSYNPPAGSITVTTKFRRITVSANANNNSTLIAKNNV
jgi:hypothetical protein